MVHFANEKIDSSYIDPLISDWVKRINECKYKGHRHPVDIEDSAMGYCAYCETYFARTLTSRELNKINDEQKKIRSIIFNI